MVQTDSKGFFKLAEECYLIQGARRGAIYNLITGDVFSLNPQSTQLLVSCERNVPVNTAANDAGFGVEVAGTFLEGLENQRLGMFTTLPRYVDKYRIGDNLKTESFYRDPPYIRTAFLEIGNACNFNCSFCKTDSLIPRHQACYGCYRKSDSGYRMELTEIEKTLEQLGHLEVQELVLTGGNPLMLSLSRMRALLDTIGNNKFGTVRVITNGVPAEEGMLELLLENRVSPVFQVFSDDSSIHENITRTAGSFKVLIASIDKFKSKGVPFAIALLITSPILDRITETVSFYRSFNPEQMLIDTLGKLPGFKSGQDNDIAIDLPEYLSGPQKIPVTSVQDFFNKTKHHPCLQGKIAITESGKVLPCPQMNDDIVGDLRLESIHDIFADKNLDKYWDLTKDKIENCRLCEYRFACFDCRALGKSASGHLYGMDICNYQPEKGEWVK